MWLTFWDFNKLNDWASQWKKSNILQLTRWEVMALKSEQEIAADNGMTEYRYLQNVANYQ